MVFKAIKINQHLFIRNKHMTTAAVSEAAAKNGLAVTDSIKMEANRIYGQGTQVYPAKSGAVYKGDITILDTHVLQEIGKNSVILHDKSKLDYASEVDLANKMDKHLLI